MDLVVKTVMGSPEARCVWDGREMACVVGKNGPRLANEKREGDGCTPQGRWKVLYGMYRADRVEKPAGGLVWRAITREDGWCDAADDPLYNQLVPVGYGASHEVLWREDAAYDYIVVLDHNQPAVSGAGSAVFLHVWCEGATHTAGCVALRIEDLEGVLGSFGVRDGVEIVRG